MIQRKKRFSWLLMLFWGSVFVFGLYQVYLFLQGGSFTPEMKKGYMEISSDSSVFIDNEYAFSEAKDDQYLVGNYDVCFEKIGFNPRCIYEVGVTSNNQDITTIKGEVLLSDTYNIKKDWLTDEKVYFFPNEAGEPINNGFFWHDPLKKQIFWGGGNDEFIHSEFLSYDVERIFFDSQKEQYCLEYFTEELEIDVHCLDHWSSRSFSFSPLSNETLFEYDPHSISRLHPGKSFLVNAKQEQRIVFSEEAMRVPLTQRSSLLVFDTAIFLFSENTEDFRLVTTKDADSGVGVYPRRRQIYFSEDGSFWRLYL